MFNSSNENYCEEYNAWIEANALIATQVAMNIRKRRALLILSLLTLEKKEEKKLLGLSLN